MEKHAKGLRRAVRIRKRNGKLFNSVNRLVTSQPGNYNTKKKPFRNWGGKEEVDLWERKG